MRTGRVVSLNPIAEALTGWGADEAKGLPLEAVFQIVNEDTRRPVENPALRALDEGRIVGLANHTVLIARDGTREAHRGQCRPDPAPGRQHLRERPGLPGRERAAPVPRRRSGGGSGNCNSSRTTPRS